MKAKAVLSSLFLLLWIGGNVFSLSSCSNDDNDILDSTPPAVTLRHGDSLRIANKVSGVLHQESKEGLGYGWYIEDAEKNKYGLYSIVSRDEYKKRTAWFKEGLTVEFSGTVYDMLESVRQQSAYYTNYYAIDLDEATIKVVE